jgi:hypothetical protein
MSSKSDEAGAKAEIEEKLQLERNAKAIAEYLRTTNPLLITRVYILGQDALIRLVVGDTINGDFVPKGSIVMDINDFQRLIGAGGEHLEKVAKGMMKGREMVGKNGLN